MDSCSWFKRARNWVALRSRVNRRKLLAIGLAGISLAFGPEGQAQLRTGRETRALYHDQLNDTATSANSTKAQPQPFQRSKRSSSEANRTSEANRQAKRHPARSSAPEVVSASYARPTRSSAEMAETNSILENKKPTEVGSGVAERVVAEPAAILDEGSYIEDSHVDGESYFSGPAHEGYLLAPACAGACDPCESYLSGYGPIGVLLGRMRVRAELPIYWRRAHQPPALVTTGTGTSTGALGATGTSILLGNTPFGDEAHAGFRLTLGTWLTSDQHYGLEFKYWNAGEKVDAFNFDSSVTPLLARPFLDTSTNTTGTANVQTISAANDSTGSINAEFVSNLDGFNVVLRRLVYRDRFTRIDWLHGYSHVGIDEELNISSFTLVTANRAPGQGSSIAVTDRFLTENSFHGGLNGVMHTREFGGLRIESQFRLGMGNLRRKVNINGTTVTTSAPPNAQSFTRNQGLLARDTNSQPFADDTFVVVPEVGVNLGYRLRRNLDFSLGYHYMMMPKVGQASRQLDPRLASNLSDPLTGSRDPRLVFEERNYWVHSLGFGVQWKY